MEAWSNFLVQQEKELGATTVNKWLRPLRLVHFDACNLFLEAKDSFQVMWFEEHIRHKISNLFLNNNKKPIKVHLTIANQLITEKKKKMSSPKTNENETSKSLIPFQLNIDESDPHCTFPFFAMNENNELTLKVLSKVCGYDPDSQIVNPNRKELSIYNPIYIYGPSGTGKSHLLMSFCSALKELNVSVHYVRAETFTEHVISAIRAGEMRLFRQTYRSTDVLIIDDVHMFSRKGATQEELFHTFNTLHLSGKQILLSANCSPSELQEIEPRLVSRFEWGIVLSLPAPSPQLTRDILEYKLKALDFKLHGTVKEYLLDSFRNPKSLCRAVEALILRNHLNSPSKQKSSTMLTVPMVSHCLSDLIDEEHQTALTPEKVVQSVVEYFGICMEDVHDKGQSRDRVLPRQIAMYLCRHELKMPYQKIGEYFSRDHSTAMASVKLIHNKLEENTQEVVAPISGIMKMLRN